MATSYEKRLKIPLTGDTTTLFTTKFGLLVSDLMSPGYTRIVIGKRGPYIEFAPAQIEGEHLHIPADQKYRLTDKRIYYVELRTIDKCNVKVYHQYKTVAYADYKIGYVYISPFDLLADGKVIIDKLKG